MNRVTDISDWIYEIKRKEMPKNPYLCPKAKTALLSLDPTLQYTITGQRMTRNTPYDKVEKLL